MPLVSIVVPVYNTSLYLDSCIESLLSQTVADIEIILVDDGSTDGSSAKCDMLALADFRIKVIHKENGGLSDARNCGAMAATAPFIGFVDSDDVVCPEMYEILLRDIAETGADIATCNVLELHEKDFLDRDISNVELSKGSPEVLTGKDALGRMLRSEDLPKIWVPTRLYPRWLFEQGFVFPVGRTYEDAYTIVDIFSKMKTVSVNSSPLYCYLHHDNTITSSPYTEKTHDIIIAWERCSNQISKQYPDLIRDADFRCYWARCVVLDKMIAKGGMEGSDEEADIVAYLRSRYSTVKKHRSLSRSRKMLLKLLLLNLAAYRYVVRHAKG